MPLLSIGAVLCSAYVLTQYLNPTRLYEYVIFYYVALTGQIILFAYILSFFEQLDNRAAWTGITLATCLPLIAVSRNHLRLTVPLKTWWAAYKALPILKMLLMTTALLAVMGVGVVNLALVLFTPPINWDSQVYHIARVAYYLQQGSFAHYDANYTHQVIYGKNATALLAYIYSLTRNENWMQVSQYIAYWVILFCVYGIARRIDASPNASLLAALFAGMLPILVLEASTTQNDLIVTAYLGVIVYGLFAYRQNPHWRYVVIAVLGGGLAAGTKATALIAAPSLLIVAIYTLLRKETFNKHTLSVLVVSAEFAILVFVLPSGYVQNYRVYGNITGPVGYRMVHTFEGQAMDYRLRNGTKNVFRFGVHFFAPDGLPGFTRLMQTIRRNGMGKSFSALGLDLESPEASVVPFTYDLIYPLNEDYAYWGILGFALMLPLTLLALLDFTRPLLSPLRILALSLVVFVVGYAYAGPYDPWKGRHLSALVIFAAPILAGYWSHPKTILQGYVLVIAVAGFVSVFNTMRIRTWNLDFFRWDRLEQLSARHNGFDTTINRYEELVPKDAVVAAYVNPNNYEFALFGKGMTRTVIPVGQDNRDLEAILARADYLVYTLGKIDNRVDDVILGPHLFPEQTFWTLRKLDHTDTKHLQP